MKVLKRGEKSNRPNRVLMILFAALFLFISLTGCSSSSSKKADSVPMETTSGTAAFYNKSTSATATENRGYQGRAPQIDDGVKETKENIKKVIKNGEIAVEVKDVEDAYQKIIEIVERVGGRIQQEL